MNVELYRPERRFGWAVVVWRNDPYSGKRQVLRWSESGAEHWDDVTESDGTTFVPTYFMADEVINALVRIWTDAHPSTSQPNTQDVLIEALTDTRTVRNRLLSLVEENHRRLP